MVFTRSISTLAFATLLFISIAAAPSRAQVHLRPAFPGIGFDAPVDIQHPGDGSGRLFVVDRAGVIHVLQKDESGSKKAVFLDIRERVRPGVEEGLLGLAFHPNYSENGRFYVYYTSPTPTHSVLSTFTVSEADSNRADPTSESVLLKFEQPHEHHNAGQLRFGPDGYLYISTGDGGGFEEERGTGEDLRTLLGSILRIDVDRTEGNRGYGIPPDNPFADNTSGYREEIYAYGFRNPWRFSFDRKDFEAEGSLDKPRIWVGDVGSGIYEEVNLVERGKTYGWRDMEGKSCHPLSPNCDTLSRVHPIWFYGHDVGRAVIGGFVYRGDELSWLEGQYVYGDFASGRIWSLTYVHDDSVRNEELLHADSLRIYAFGEDAEGELYVSGVTAESGGVVYRLAPAAVPPSNEEDHLSDIFMLIGNHPNPFRDETAISYTIEKSVHVDISVYNVIGQKVRTLLNGVRSPGSEQVRWDGTDDSRRAVPAGIYFYRMTSDSGHFDSGRMVLIR